MKTSATILALLYITAFAQQKDTFTDTRDGKTYKTTKIGEQTWMAENLNYNVSGSKCYENETKNCGKYGRLYDWATAMKACPKGWHLPSNDEWDKLYCYADGDKCEEGLYYSEIAGKYLKSKEGWNDNNGKSGNGEDTYSFSALPGGSGNSVGDFSDVGDNGCWWSASEGSSSYAYFRSIGYDSEYVYLNNYDKSFLFSVRCVRD
ncbi:MAG: fibrobacter succinogenes major paralogous domain-containing protein [Fibromonadaceae bacterium]|jgi:uncharacterized protein (TIGR02145 family)|nr:fibrobacter succinogenes major paralogous domain-containing protein [Fibromonadaceae bacterium]